MTNLPISQSPSLNLLYPFNASNAPNRPGAPMMPPPGWVPEPHW